MRGKLHEKIAHVEREALKELSSVSTLRELETCRVRFLGKKGEVTSLLKGLKELSAKDRPLVGNEVNQLKKKLDEKLSTLKRNLSSQELKAERERVDFDLTLSGRAIPKGSQHPVTQVMDEMTEIFCGLGFSIFEGPEIETDYYNFEALNIPPDHPARDMQDTFYVEGGRLLRTHTSPVQIHVMENRKPPIAALVPGAVYRRDSDVSHSPMFHQVEGFMVDQGITFRHLKGVLSLFCHEMFGKERAVRFRSSFFPFTEPSAEVDIGCVICEGKGCRVCKGSGWVEILGCGMIDPHVFRSVGYDPKKVTGFAFGMGVERITMLKYRINDIRLLFENDLRFLEQFS